MTDIGARLYEAGRLEEPRVLMRRLTRRPR